MFDEDLFEERLKNFQPEPLVPVSDKKNQSLEIHAVKEDDDTIDLAKVNYLNFLNDDEVKNVAEDTIRQYGVGTCGPAVFYGTSEAHVEVEGRLAEFLGVETALICSFGFVNISTSVAGWLRKQDTAFIGDESNLPILLGIKESQCKTFRFAHNDVEDFRRKALQSMEEGSDLSRKRVLILEAISWNSGKICPLPGFLAVAEEFKIRVVLEESHSLGVLGTTGRGLLEHYDIDPGRVDFVFGTFEGAIGSIGGFCAGSKYVHNQGFSPGYLFSATLPAYLMKVILKTLDSLEYKPEKFSRFTKKFHAFLEEECGFNVVSDPESPFKLIDHKSQENQKIHRFCKEKGVHFICNENGLIVNLNIGLLEDQEKLNKVYEVFKGASGLIRK